MRALHSASSTCRHTRCRTIQPSFLLQHPSAAAGHSARSPPQLKHCTFAGRGDAPGSVAEENGLLPSASSISRLEDNALTSTVTGSDINDSSSNHSNGLNSSSGSTSNGAPRLVFSEYPLLQQRHAAVGQAVRDASVVDPVVAGPEMTTNSSSFSFLSFEELPESVVKEFEHKLEADIVTVFYTLFTVVGVITFWRGIWAALDHIFGDSLFGDFVCTIVGLSMVMWIRLAGIKIAKFWPAG